MKKSIFKKIGGLFLGLAMGLGVAVGVTAGNKGASPVHAADTELTFSLTSNPGGWPTTSSAGNYDYTLSDTTKYTFALGTNVYFNSTYLMLKSTTSLGLPAISGKKLTKIVASNSSGCSTSTKVGVSSSASSASYISGGAIQTWSTTSSTYTYNLTSTSANTMYYLYITNKNCQITQLKLTYASDSTPLTGITLGGAASSNAMSIGSSDLTNKTVSVTLNPLGATDQKVNIVHQGGTSGLFTVSSSATCTSGSGSFTVKGNGNTSGSETFRIKGNTETSVYVDLVVTALDDSVTYWAVSFDSDGGSPSPSSLQVEEGKTFKFPSPGTKEHFTFNGWSSDGGTTKYLTNATSPSITSNTSYSAYWTEDAKYTVTYTAGSHGTGSYPHPNQYVGEYELLPFASTGITAESGYKFKEYKINDVSYNAGEKIQINGATNVTVIFVEIPKEFVAIFGTELSNSSSAIDSDAKIKSDYGYTIDSNITFSNLVKCYPQENKSFKFGSGSAIGSFTISIPGTYEGQTIHISSITINMRAHGSDASIISVNGVNQTLTAEYADYTVDNLDSQNLTSINVAATFAANCRYHISKITIGYALSKSLTSITVGSNLHRSFDLGGTFVGETIYANYSSGDPVDVTSSATFSDYDMSTLGDQTVNVSYSDSFGSANTSYTINVHYATVTSVQLSREEVSIGVGETFDLSNITVTISPSNADQNTYSWSVAEDEGALESSKYTFDATNKTLTAEVDGYVKLQCTAGSQNAYLIVNITAEASASFLVSEIEGIANVTSAKEMTVSVSNYTSITSYDWNVETIDPEEGDVDVVEITNENSATTSVSFLHEGIATVSVNVELINKQGSTETVSASFDVYVTKQLASIIAALVDSDKTYAENTNVPASDITVTKVYSDGQTDTATGFTVTEPLVSLTDESVKVSYTEGGITKTADVTVTVVKAQLSSLSFTNKTLNQFKEGDAVNGVFSLGSKATITAKYATSFGDETVVTDGELQSGIRGELRFELCSRTGTSSYTYTKVVDIELGDPMLRSYNGLYLRTFYKYDNEVYADAAQVTVAAPDVQVVVQEESEDGYNLVTNPSQLEAGDQIIITGTTYSLGLVQYASGSNCKSSGITKSDDATTLTEVGGSAILTLSDAGSGNFYLSDGTKYYYAASNSGNQLKAKDSKDSSNGAWKFTYSNGAMSIVADGSSNRNVMMLNYNGGSPLFACYSSAGSYDKLQVYKYTKGGLEDKYYTCSENLYDAIAASQALLDTECLAKDVQESTWSTISGYFSSFTSGDDYKILTEGKSLSKLLSGNIAEDFLARYDQIVHDYGYNNFLNRAEISGSRINPILALNKVDSSVWVISVVALVGLTAIGGYFFYRKKKENF